MRHINNILFFLLIFIILLQNNSNSVECVYVCNGTYAYAYHSDINCLRINHCKKEKVIMSYNEAKYKYRKGCSQCWTGPFEYTGINSITKSQKKTSVQCRATTKKGTQCSRKASNGGYCYQHK